MKLNIAIGKSRHDKIWVNKQILWEDFLKRLEKTNRTHETLKEYLAMSIERQSEIKDVGGFVSGFLDKGRRLINSVVSKQMLTLDVDEATKDFWDIVRMQFDCACAIYTTHKHQQEKPKYRLLIPLSREVMKDEYEAICRKVTELIGIDMFDHTCYRVNQLMYWPSTSKDGQYIFDQQKGPWMDPDEILDMYRDWQDITEWPLGSREKKSVKTHLGLQGDPLAKPGLIGHFNNSYSISEAIDTFLPGIYEKSDNGEGRYTYLAGSTYGGVIVYDDKFIYSHHSTDPISGVLCNAFDMVRYHKFILEDHDCDDSVPINKRPSFIAMSDFAIKDDRVKRHIGESKLALAKQAFEEVEEDDEEEDKEWLEQMDFDRKGNYIATINNVALILDNDKSLKGAIAYDEFQQQPIFKKNVPWRKVKQGSTFITDNDLANLENYIEKVYAISAGGKFLKGLSVVLEKNKFHPIVQYLKSLEWDGEKRLDHLLVKYLGCDDSVYVRTVTRKAFVACVARVMEPGIKFDNVLTLVGKEGQGKSALLDNLGEQWFSDTFSMHMLQSKEAYEQIQGAWIIEIGELAGMAKADIERVKSFISARKDRYRAPYGRTTDERPRQCVFFASTNKWDFLKSQTGNRRFWPVETMVQEPEASVHDLTKQDVKQIWAEAYELYKKGEKLYLDQTTNDMAITMQYHYTEEDPWVEIFDAYLKYDVPENWYDMSRYEKLEFIQMYGKEERKEKLYKRVRVCTHELWEIALEKKDKLDSFNIKLIRQAMSKLTDWVKDPEAVRFGTTYPRHRGSYMLKETFNVLLN